MSLRGRMKTGARRKRGQYVCFPPLLPPFLKKSSASPSFLAIYSKRHRALGEGHKPPVKKKKKKRSTSCSFSPTRYRKSNPSDTV